MLYELISFENSIKTSDLKSSLVRFVSKVGLKLLFTTSFIIPWLFSTNLFLALSICEGVDSSDFIVVTNSWLVSDICLFLSVTLSVI